MKFIYRSKSYVDISSTLCLFIFQSIFLNWYSNNVNSSKVFKINYNFDHNYFRLIYIRNIYYILDIYKKKIDYKQ